MNFYHSTILPKILDCVMQKKELGKLRPEVARAACGVVLEIGFGSGLNLPFYQRVTQLYALEPSSVLYKMAEERVKRAGFPVTFLEASAERIPLGDKSMDMVVSTWSLCSIPDVKLALQEVKRVLKDEGVFLFLEHGKSPSGFVRWVQKCLSPFSRRIAGCTLDRSIDELVREAGFCEVTVTRFPLPRRPLYFMYRGRAVGKK